MLRHHPDFLLCFWPSPDEIEETADDDYMAGLGGFYKSLDALNDSVKELSRGALNDPVKELFYSAGTPAERGQIPRLSPYTDVDHVDGGTGIHRNAPPLIVEWIFAVGGVGGIATGFYSLLKLWLEVKKGRKIRVKAGPLQVEATQLTPEEFERLFQRIAQLSSDKSVEGPHDMQRRLKAEGLPALTDDEVAAEGQALRKAAYSRRANSKII